MIILLDEATSETWSGPKSPQYSSSMMPSSRSTTTRPAPLRPRSATKRSTMGATSEKSYPTVVVGGVDVGRVVAGVESVALVTVAAVASDVGREASTDSVVPAGPDGSGAVASSSLQATTPSERAEEHAVGGTAEPLTDRCHNRSPSQIVPCRVGP